MTIFEYAMCSIAGRRMTQDELQKARILAEKADRGDKIARSAFMRLVNAVLTKEDGSVSDSSSNK